MVKNIKICYIGGGSKLWARVFMSDLALAQNLGGEIALYDIDKPAAERNAAELLHQRDHAHDDGDGEHDDAEHRNDMQRSGGKGRDIGQGVPDKRAG